MKTFCRLLMKSDLMNFLIWILRRRSSFHFFLSFIFYVAVFNLLCCASFFFLHNRSTQRSTEYWSSSGIVFMSALSDYFFMFLFCFSFLLSISRLRCCVIVNLFTLLFCYYCGSSAWWKRVSEYEWIDGATFDAKKTTSKEILFILEIKN